MSSTVLEALNAALHAAMEDERVILLGEDVLDPYGGAFKVLRGLSTQYPQRVLTTPVSEAGMVGIAGGMALRGMRPVVEIMFGDFTTLIVDQVVNSLSKFRWMYNDAVEVPVVIRTPMGGRRGYGPTHSQTLEKLFFGAPGLRVLAPSAIGEPGELLRRAILEDDRPVIFIENKLLYLQKINDGLDEFEVETLSTPNSYASTYKLNLHGSPPPHLTLTAYGYMAGLARQAAQELAYQHEIFCELIVPTQLTPFEIDPIINSARQTGKLLAIEEGTLTHGWGAEILARTAEQVALKAARRVAAPDQPIPASVPQENETLPSVASIVESATKMK